MSPNRSGLVDLIRLAGKPGLQPPKANLGSVRKTFQNIPLKKEHFSEDLRLFVDILPWNKVNAEEDLKFLRALPDIQLWGEVKEELLTGQPFDFHGVTLGNFLTTMASRAGVQNVRLSVHSTDVHRIYIGIRMPTRGQTMGITFFLEAKRQGLGWIFEITGHSSGIVPNQSNQAANQPSKYLLPGG